jgi:hypothetical protein
VFTVVTFVLVALTSLVVGIFRLLHGLSTRVYRHRR